MKVLVAEDTEDSQLLFQQILERVGFKVRIAARHSG